MPILGCELYICQKDDHRAEPQGDDYNHLLVLAENEEGYRNLVRITSEASLHGFYKKPRVSKKYLAEHAKGLIGFSGCLCRRALRKPDGRQVRGGCAPPPGSIRTFSDAGISSSKFRIRGSIWRRRSTRTCSGWRRNSTSRWSRRTTAIICARTMRMRTRSCSACRPLASINDPKRFKFDSDQFYVKSAEEMERLFAHAPEVVSRTMQFAERCHLKLHKVDNPFPEFAVPAGHTIDSYFEQVCREGLRKRLETAVRQLELRGVLRTPVHEYESRLNFEIGIIKQMKYSGYFLIVWDFIKYARDHGIPVGPGRGSATGSLVAYAMEITNIDPMQNVLLFERFLNPERVTMPDIDVDFCQNRRGEVIDYVTRKYGREQVAQIITFNTMAAKAAIKDVGRALDMPYGDVDRIAKLVPATVGVTLDRR